VFEGVTSFFPFLTESYLNRKACLMELAWAMKYRKRVQPLHLPTERDKIKDWRRMVPQTFNWVFSIDVLPVEDSDSRILRRTISFLLSEAEQGKICPPLPDGMNEHEVVNQAMLETREINRDDYRVGCTPNDMDEGKSSLSFDTSTHVSAAFSCEGDFPSKKLFLSYEEKEAKLAVNLFKTELQKLGHRCRLSMNHRHKSTRRTTEDIIKCDVFFIILTEGYLTLEKCLMEVAWAMKYGKKVQPLHLPSAKTELGYWISITPQAFRWIFAINILPLEDVDPRLLNTTIPIILSDAYKTESAPPLPEGMDVEETVRHAMLEVEYYREKETVTQGMLEVDYCREKEIESREIKHGFLKVLKSFAFRWLG